MRAFVLGTLTALFVAATAPVALASPSSPTQSAYSGVAAKQLSRVDNASAQRSPGSTTTLATSASSTLPFTGLNVGIVVAVAVALVGSGFVLRRTARRS